ncbi:MMPL family transporter, partial [Thiorhodococcus mannitoliphagus]
MFESTVLFALAHPRRIILITVLLAVALLAAFPFVRVDVDPESMLSADEPVRVEHNRIKDLMALHDMIVVGVTRDAHPDGVFNPDSLARLRTLTDDIAGLDGVLAHDMLTPGQVDAIEPGGPGTIRFERLMAQPPTDQAGALRVRQRLMDNPFLWETMISTDGRALAFYVPLAGKQYSWRVAEEIKRQVAALDGPEAYHIAGLPVAEDTFGVEMFIQMAISAPLAMLLIGALIWSFVRNLRLTAAALLVALLSVIITMGLFIATGNTLHIMSSMIPIFIMPIAVLDAVHILSQFFDSYRGERRAALVRVMRDLWQPMLFTSLTSSAGFLSLLWAPIPPIQAFGLFTGLGILVAWVLSMTFLPAFISLIPERALAGFGAKRRAQPAAADAALARAPSWLDRGLATIHGVTEREARAIVVLALLLAAGAVLGITKLQINDNPVKWFEPSHDIRAADRLINERFGGSYLVYLTLTPPPDARALQALQERLTAELPALGAEGEALADWLSSQPVAGIRPLERLTAMRQWIDQQMSGADPSAETAPSQEPVFEMEDADAPPDDSRARWLALDRLVEDAMRPYQIMKQPAMLDWLDRMLSETQSGTGHSVVQLIKKVNKELHEGDAAAYRVPDTARQVMETYVSFQGSHDLNRLWHMITPDYGATTVLLQLRQGDNQDVAAAVAELERWMAAHPSPVALRAEWSGLAYLNIIWQERMVSGMLYALGGSLLIVYLAMLFLYRCFWWSLLSMLPLSLSILLVYGLLGLLGKDYDMPVAVLSALALGLAVDFAIHFNAHLRLYGRQSPPRKAIAQVFGEPGRGIARNAELLTWRQIQCDWIASNTRRSSVPG